MIRCIAIDDEPLALAQISSYINKVPYLELVGRCRDAAEALKVLRQTQVDLMFVDINMPDLNGLDFVRSLEEPPKVIFTTAYSHYAVDGYKVQAVDYLLKPFGLSDLEAAAERARQRIESETSAYGFVPQPTSAIEQDGYFYVKNDYRSRTTIASSASSSMTFAMSKAWANMCVFSLKARTVLSCLCSR